MGQVKHIDSVGWIFWLVCFVLFSAPCIYWAWQQKYESTPWGTPIIIGMVAGAIIAGMFSSAVNWVLQRRARNRQLAERKLARKKKK